LRPFGASAGRSKAYRVCMHHRAYLATWIRLVFLLSVFMSGGAPTARAADDGTMKEYLLVGDSDSFRGTGATNYLVVRFRSPGSLDAFLGNASEGVEVIELSPGVAAAVTEAAAAEEPRRPPAVESPKEVAAAGPETEPEPAPAPGAWKRVNSRWVTAVPVGGLFLDFVRFGQGEDSRNQVGDLTDFEKPEVRGIRAGAVGTVNFDKPWLWAVFGAYNGFSAGFERGETPVWSLFDLWVEVPVPKLGLVTVGRAKEPFSMERMMAGGLVGFMERAVGTDAFTPSRVDGASIKGSFAQKRMNWAGGYSVSGLGKERETGHSFVGRLAGLPLDDPHGKGLLHVATAVRHAEIDTFTFRVTPEFSSVPNFVDTEEIDGDGATYLLGEVYYRRKSLFFASEQIYNWVRSPQAGDPFFWSAFAQASWTVTGEGRDYDYDRGYFRIMTPRSEVTAGGKGLLELALRYSAVDLDDVRIRGGKLSKMSTSVNWHLKRNVITNFTYGLARLDRKDVIGYTHFYQARVGVIF